jgi:hypothetical protein
MENSLPALSQYGLQYLLLFATGHPHPGWAHLSGFFSLMSGPPLSSGGTEDKNPLDG